MAVTVAATKIGSLTSVARAQAQSAGAGVAAFDTLTVNHGLGKSPHSVVATVRTLITTPSGEVPAIIVNSWDATKVVLHTSSAQATNLLVDVVVVFEHSIVQ